MVTMITTSIPKYDAYVPGVRALSVHVAYMYIILVNQAIIQASQHHKYKQTSANNVNIIYYIYLN